MNTRQKTILIVGAIALLIVTFTTPKYFVIGNMRYPVSLYPKVTTYPQVDIQAGILRVIGVTGATLLITYALKDRKDK